ncbi:MAG: PAS domain S-box protein, partial [bacterium]|nr:PAS domain S-box protein [bacterium]
MPDQLGVKGTVFNGRHITHRKRIEEALFHSEEILRTTLTSISDLVFSLDREGKFIDYHQPAQHPDLYAPPEDFLGKNYRDVMPPHISELMGETIDNALSSGLSRIAEYCMEVNDARKWFEAKVSVRRNPEGDSIGVTVVVRNITERKQAEDALRNGHDFLEQRVEERTKELKQV